MRTRTALILLTLALIGLGALNEYDELQPINLTAEDFDHAGQK